MRERERRVADGDARIAAAEERLRRATEDVADRETAAEEREQRLLEVEEEQVRRKLDAPPPT